VGRNHLARRLERQVNYSAIQFTGSGLRFHWENFEPAYKVLRVILKMLGLLERGMENTLDYRLEKNEVFFNSLPECLSGFTILQLSDLHIDGISDGGQRLGEIIQTLHFDLCVITGDFRFMTFFDYEKAMADMETLAVSLQCEHGVVSILGNHDFIEMVPLLESMGIRVLLNEAVAIERKQEKIWIAGVDDCHFYQVHDLSKALGEIPADGFKILLAHSPELMDEAERAGVQYYLSGHTHGGQICLPGNIPIITNAKCPRKFVSGSWLYRNMAGYTSRGTGSSGLPVRFFSPPEITLHTLHSHGRGRTGRP